MADNYNNINYMEIKNINEDLIIVCEGYSTRNSWGHIVRAIYNGRTVATYKVRYYNRTWEAYTYQTAMFGLVDVLDLEKIVPLKDRVSMYRAVKFGIFA